MLPALHSTPGRHFISPLLQSRELGQEQANGLDLEEQRMRDEIRPRPGRIGSRRDSPENVYRCRSAPLGIVSAPVRDRRCSAR